MQGFTISCVCSIYNTYLCKGGRTCDTKTSPLVKWLVTFPLGKRAMTEWSSRPFPGSHVGQSWIACGKTQYRKFETNISRKGIARPQSQFPHSCVCEWFIYSHDRSACILLQENMWTDPGNIKIAHRHMSVEIGTEAARSLFWEHINGIFLAAWDWQSEKSIGLSPCRNRERVWVCILQTKSERTVHVRN